MGSKSRALKRHRGGGKKLFQERRKRLKRSSNNIQLKEEAVEVTLNEAISSL